MRSVLLELAATILSLLLGGCVSATTPIVEDDTQPVPVPIDVPPGSVSVSASPDAFAAIHEWLGDENTITVGKPLTVNRPEVVLNVPAGANVSYSITDEAGVFQFAKPLPTVKAKVLGFSVSPSLSQVTLKPDGSGVASTGLGRYRFQWLAEEDAGTPAAQDLPEVWAYSQVNCPPCNVAKKELAEATDLPFRVVWKEDAPSWLSSRPAFWWHTSASQPSQSDVANTRQSQGWSGIKKFRATWEASRQPKKFERASVSHPFARPDPSSIGSRSVAKWSINGDFTPSRSVLLSHLANDGIHRGQHDSDWLNSLSTEQLRWLHDRDHGD